MSYMAALLVDVMRRGLIRSSERNARSAAHTLPPKAWAPASAVDDRRSALLRGLGRRRPASAAALAASSALARFSTIRTDQIEPS